ncbi:MAG: hypothetical protein AB9856_16785 [Cellulosilyticaceae bacterium]
MKNVKSLLVLLFVIIFVGGQAYYFTSIHPLKVSELESTNSDVKTKERQLQKLTEGLKNIEVTKKQAIGKTLALNGMQAKLPPYTMAAMQLLDMSRMMESSNFKNITITCQDPLALTVGETPLTEVPYTLKYISTYKASKAFVENLRGAYQFVTISSMNMSNSPQGDTEKVQRYDETMQKQVVETTLEVKLLFDSTVSKEELYHSTLNIIKNPNGAFESVKEPEQEGEAQSTFKEEHNPAPKENSTSEVTNDATFSLDIYDILRSGDTYRFQGPSPNSPTGEYVGLVSSDAVYITLNVKNDGYSITLDDHESTPVAGGSTIPIKNPGLIITSEAKQIQEEMPSIHIAVNNANANTLPIILQGTLLDNIHIYDDSGNELNRGETSGNISLN